MNQPPYILFWNIKSAHSAKLSGPVLHKTGSNGIKTIFSLFHMNFVDFSAHKKNSLLTCTVQVTRNKSANGISMCLETYCGISALDLCWKETTSCTKVCSMFLCGLVSTTDWVETAKLISHVAQTKFQGRSLEMKSQNINPLYIVAPCYISITVSQLNCHLHEMKAGHGVLPGGNRNAIFYTMQNYFNYEVRTLSFYKIIVPNVSCPIPQIPLPEHPGIKYTHTHTDRHTYIYIGTHMLYNIRNLSHKKSKLHHSLYH